MENNKKIVRLIINKDDYDKTKWKDYYIQKFKEKEKDLDKNTVIIVEIWDEENLIK